MAASELMATVADEGARKRRNVRLALIHVAIALGFMLAFMWVQAHK